MTLKQTKQYLWVSVYGLLFRLLLFYLSECHAVLNDPTRLVWYGGHKFESLLYNGQKH